MGWEVYKYPVTEGLNNFDTSGIILKRSPQRWGEEAGSNADRRGAKVHKLAFLVSVGTLQVVLHTSFMGDAQV